MLLYFVLKIEGTQWLCVVLCINFLERDLGRGRRGLIKIKRGTERQPRKKIRECTNTFWYILNLFFEKNHMASENSAKTD